MNKKYTNVSLEKDLIDTIRTRAKGFKPCTTINGYLWYLVEQDLKQNRLLEQGREKGLELEGVTV